MLLRTAALLLELPGHPRGRSRLRIRSAPNGAWPSLSAIAVLLSLFSLELVFLGANLLKVNHGARCNRYRRHLDHDQWTWLKSVSVLREKTTRQDIPLSQLTALVERKSEHAPVRLVLPGRRMLIADPEY